MYTWESGLWPAHWSPGGYDPGLGQRFNGTMRLNGEAMDWPNGEDEMISRRAPSRRITRPAIIPVARPIARRPAPPPPNGGILRRILPRPPIAPAAKPTNGAPPPAVRPVDATITRCAVGYKTMGFGKKCMPIIAPSQPPVAPPVVPPAPPAPEITNGLPAPMPMVAAAPTLERRLPWWPFGPAPILRKEAPPSAPLARAGVSVREVPRPVNGEKPKFPGWIIPAGMAALALFGGGGS